MKIGTATRRTRRNGSSPPVEAGGYAPFHIPDLLAELRQLVAQVPAGRVTTYGRLAEALGDVRAARWVAACLFDIESVADLPHHRVVFRDGSLGRAGSPATIAKRQALVAEGIDVEDNRIDLSRFAFHRLNSTGPLRGLQMRQEALATRVVLRRRRLVPDLVGGVDVSYARQAPTGRCDAAAAYALVETATGRLVDSQTLCRTVHFPYIPGYLAFRELPILLELLDQVRQAGRLADVLFVDGNGLLHQRAAGIATHLGVLASVATVGIGKSLLCGKVALTHGAVGAPRPVVHAGRTVAAAIRPGAVGKTIYVSPGDGVDLRFATALAARLLRGHHVPAPIHFAHQISRRAVAGRR
ncbi:MAG: endonuclease V [Planctomycetaceae bacterium]